MKILMVITKDFILYFKLLKGNGSNTIALFLMSLHTVMILKINHALVYNLFGDYCISFLKFVPLTIL